ncbi:C-type lectin domain family 11 member A [Rhinophrynus dorsalis]
MFWGGVFFCLLCIRQIPKSLAEEQNAELKSGTETGGAAEKQVEDLEKILLGLVEVIIPHESSPLHPPKTEKATITLNITTISDSQNVPEKETEDIEEEEEEVEEEENIVEDKAPTVAQPSTTPPVDDNFSYILSRLSAIEAAIHRLNVQFYGLDVKVNQMSQSLSKVRNKLTDAEDTIATVSEMNLRNQRQIGQIEGCFKGRRLLRKCYLIFQHFENYATAQQLCHNRGGNLAMPIDELEHAALAKYVHDAFFPFNWPVWIGINDLRAEGLYLYENGHRVSFFNWYKDNLVAQPNGRTLENCVSITSDDGKWWDNDCSRRMYYVCEY